MTELNDDIANTFGFYKGDLHPDLAPYVDGSMLRHPLVQTIVPAPGFCGHINRLYSQKLEFIAAAGADGNWTDVVFAHERPYRADAVRQLIDDARVSMDDKGVWELISSVWTDSENVEQYNEFWEELWSHPNSRLAMTKKEERAFSNLSDPVKVWHGLERNDDRLIGISWTTSKKVATWFAKRFAFIHEREAYLAEGVIPKHKVRSYLLARKEFEIITLPTDVETVSIQKLKVDKD
jgi:hypothetical protein